MLRLSPKQLQYANVAVLAPILIWSLFQTVPVRRNGGTYPRWLSSASPLVDATAVYRSDHSGEAAAIAAEARRTAAVVRDLVIFARNDEVVYEAVSLGEVTERGLGTLRYFLCDRGVVAEHRCDDDVPSVHANVGALERVIINLVINAAQAMETHSGERLVRISAGRTVGGVHVTVEDSGPGFAPG